MGSKVIAVVEYQTSLCTASVTRPANTTLYTAGDVISDVTTNNHFTFTDAVKKGPSRLSGALSSAICVSSANQTTKPDLELWLFRSDVAEVADNAAFAPSDAELLTCIGIIAFPVASWKAGLSGSGAAGNAICVVTDIALAFQAASTTIYGQLVVRNGYTPVSGEVFTVSLLITQD